MQVRIREKREGRHFDIQWWVESRGLFFWKKEGAYSSLFFAKEVAKRLLEPDEEAKFTYDKVVWESPVTRGDCPGP